ncbi:MAG: hypothetical protein KAR79_04060 [Simkaniaceae bacterium]|nr:hypothetical protein [Simkaniaceae bacterium]
MKKIPQFLSPLSWITLFCLFCMFSISLKASDCQVLFKAANTSSIIEKEIEREIKSYLMSNSCYPVLTNNDIKYEIRDIFEESGIVYMLGILSQGKICLLTVFSIEKGWFSTTTDMLYMTIDFPISPLLYKDVCSVAQAALPNRLSDYHVLIQKHEDPQSEGYLLVWTFYNLSEWIELTVLLIPTQDGGMDFSVTRPR